MAKSLFPATPSDDSTFFQEMQNEQSALGKQALEVFRETEKDNKYTEIDEQWPDTSRQLLESLTTGKSFTQLYQEAVNEQEKQKLLIKQIADTMGNPELTFEQKHATIDQLEQDCGNMMYVIAFNTLVEKHAISPQFTHENYQQLISIDQSIQERRDRDIGDLMQTVADLVNQSTTITDPAARRDIITKMSILMILWSGINVRKMYEAELTRLKQEFASLFFTIPPGKNGSGTKKLLRTMQKSYTSVELSADLDKKYPPLAQFVEMIDDLLVSSEDKNEKVAYGRAKFVHTHNYVHTIHNNKIADAIDNVPPAEVWYTWVLEHNQKILEQRNKIHNDPQKLQDYFALLYFIADAAKDSRKIQDFLRDMGVAEMIKYTVFNTKRQRMMNETFTLDIKKVSPEVAKILVNNSIPFMFELFLHEKWRARCAEHLWKERIYRHIRTADTSKDHLDHKQLVEKVWLDTLKAHPDGMWILMKCMTEELKEQRYNDVQFDAFGNAYFKKEVQWELEFEGENKMWWYDYYYGASPGKERVWRSLDGNSIILTRLSEDPQIAINWEYVVEKFRTKIRTPSFSWVRLYKNLKIVFGVETTENWNSDLIWSIEDDCCILQRDREANYEIYDFKNRWPAIGHIPISTISDNCMLSGISDWLIKKVNNDNHRTKSYLDTFWQEKLAFDPEKYSNSWDFHDGLAWVETPHTQWPLTTFTYGFIDKTGKEVIPCEYDGVTDFSEWLARVRKDGAHYFINQQNEIALSLDAYFSKIDKNASPEKQDFYLQHAHPFACGFTRVEYQTPMNPARFGEQGHPQSRTRFYDKTWKLLKFPGSMIITAASDFCGWIAKVETRVNGDYARWLIDTFGNFYPVKG
jgi:hypothetical protein